MKSVLKFDKNRKDIQCQNCSRPLSGDENFCPECGQVNDTRRLSIKDFFSDFFSNFFSFDSRLYRTIYLLFAKPGRVSTDYINGKRKTYTNPFKLLLHTVILYFLLVGITNTVQEISNNNEPQGTEKNELRDNTLHDGFMTIKINDKKYTLHEQYRHQLDSLFFDAQSVLLDSFTNKKKKDSILNSWFETGIQTFSWDMKKEPVKPGEIRAFLDDLYDVNEVLTGFLKDKKVDFKGSIFSFTAYQKKYKDIEKLQDSDGVFKKFIAFISYYRHHRNYTVSQSLDSMGLPSTGLNRYVYKKARKSVNIFDNNNSMQGLLNEILSKVSLALFVILPLFTLFISLIYLTHRYQYSEHLVVVFNIQTAFFILLTIGLLLGVVFDTEFFTSTLIILFPIYIFLNHLHIYNEGFIITLIKTLLSIGVYLLFAAGGFLIITFISVVF